MQIDGVLQCARGEDPWGATARYQASGAWLLPAARRQHDCPCLNAYQSSWTGGIQVCGILPAGDRGFSLDVHVLLFGQPDITRGISRASQEAVHVGYTKPDVITMAGKAASLFLTVHDHPSPCPPH